MFVKQWWPVLTLLIPVTAIYHPQYGVVLPKDPYVVIGHNLTMMCNLTEPVPEMSTSLFFTKNNTIIPREYIQILSTRSILLKKPITSIEDEGNYVCKLRRTNSPSPIIIDNQFVEVEYELKKVKDISCIVYNWENMTCSWDLGVNYIHPKYISIQLFWTVRDRQFDCPHIMENTCTWKKVDKGDSFRTNMVYHMGVEVKNNKINQFILSSIEKIWTSQIVKPSVISDLRISYNSSCISLRWSHSQLFIYDMTFRVQYHSLWDGWKEKLIDNVNSTTICNLVPSTTYTVKVSCKPQLKGYWSQNQSATVTLDLDKPAAAPEIQPGGFVEKLCSFEGCRIIKVYWRPILERLANGRIINYHLTARDTDTPSNAMCDNDISGVVCDDTGTSTSSQLFLVTDKDYIVDVRGETEVGLSEHTARILILAKDKKPPFPEDFVVKAKQNVVDSHSYDLHMEWSKPNMAQEVLGYTIFWCNGTSDDLDCRDSLMWVVVVGQQTDYVKTVKKTEMMGLIFGISMETKHVNGVTVSSGIQWNECIYIQDNKELLPPKNVRALTLTEDNGILVEWDRFKCSETREYILQYHVYYCEAMEGQNCTNSIVDVNVSSRQSWVKLFRMSPKKTYRVWVQYSSNRGLSPLSDAVFAFIPSTEAISLTMEEIAWIVIGSAILILMSLIGLVYVFRRCAAGVKETFKPYDIETPNMPLPPIPMIKPSHTPDSEDDEIYSKIPELPSPTPSDYLSHPDAPLIKESDRFFYNKGSDGEMRCDQSSTSSVLMLLGGTRCHYKDNKCIGSNIVCPKLFPSSDSDVSPYSCVDIVCPNSEKIHRKLSNFSTEKTCHSLGSMLNDPDYTLNKPNDLSVPYDGNSAIHSGSREHFNIKLPLDRRKHDPHNYTSNEIHNNSGQTVNTDHDSMEWQSHGSYTGSGLTLDSVRPSTKWQAHGSYSGNTLDSEHTQDSNYLSEGKISSYVRETDIEPINSPGVLPPPSLDGYIEEKQLRCSNNNTIKTINGYICNIQDVLPGPREITENGGITYRKQPTHGPRPVSEVVQVPPHFYGSLSLLDSGDATEL